MRAHPHVPAVDRPSCITSRRAVCPTAILILLLLGAFARAASAQEPGAIVTVVVRDSADRPIPEAIASLAPHTGPQARTSDAGRAAFVEVAPGRYRLRVIRAGYVPADHRIDIGAGDTTITVVMRPTVTRLEEIRVIASRTGLFGKVGRATDWSPLAGVTVAVYGSRTVRTDATGAFAVPSLRPGAHLLRVEREGFVAQMRSHTVPDSGAIEVAILLDSGSTPPIYRRVLQELDQRQTWRGFDSAVVPRGELASYGGTTLSAALRQAPSILRRGLVLTEGACVYINGEPRPGWPIDAFPVEQIEAVEVYARGAELSNTLAKRWPRGATCGATPRPTRSLSTAGQRTVRARSGTVTTIVIWLKPDARH